MIASRIARGAVLRALEGLESARLELHSPDGAVHRFGPVRPEGAGSSALPEVTLRVEDPRFFTRLLLEGETGAGTSYMKGEWRTDDLVELIRLGILDRRALRNASRLLWVGAAAHRVLHGLRRNTLAGARRNVREHYDLGNEFFALFLDASLTYSCAWFGDGARTLEEAQRDKYRRIADRARLEPGQRVLEIGCGWGGFAEWAARERDVRVTGVTVSREQARHARSRIEAAGLSDRVRIERRDYREIEGRYDRVVSIEMLEAVGHRYLGRFFRAVDEALVPGGRAALQVITIPDRRYDSYRRRPDFIQRHVFPGGHLPSLGAIAEALGRGSRLVILEGEDLGPHYAETLARWRERFLDRLPEARELGYSEEFLRLWEFYLAYCEAAFRTRYVQDHQLGLSRSPTASRTPRPAEAVAR